MESGPTGANRDLFRHILVPIASPEDAQATATALTPLAPDRITMLFVVEKGGGVPDKTPVEQSEAIADDAFATFQDILPAADESVAYSHDVVSTIIERATEIDASAIVFRPRGASRIVQFLAGDKALRLITEADLPVIALPDDEAQEA